MKKIKILRPAPSASRLPLVRSTRTPPDLASGDSGIGPPPRPGPDATRASAKSRRAGREGAAPWRTQTRSSDDAPLALHPPVYLEGGGEVTIGRQDTDSYTILPRGRSRVRAGPRRRPRRRRALRTRPRTSRRPARCGPLLQATYQLGAVRREDRVGVGVLTADGDLTAVLQVDQRVERQRRVVGTAEVWVRHGAAPSLPALPGSRARPGGAGPRPRRGPMPDSPDAGSGGVRVDRTSGRREADGAGLTDLDLLHLCTSFAGSGAVHPSWRGAPKLLHTSAKFPSHGRRAS